MKVEGWVIVGPWTGDEAKSMATFAAYTFATTKGAAWNRYIGENSAYLRNAWSDKGYRPVKATMTIEVDDA